jgi:hypothetical protein
MSINLAATLPAGIPTGGTFGIAASGNALPPGATLSRDGLLSISSSATPSSIAGIVFAYETP